MISKKIAAIAHKVAFAGCTSLAVLGSGAAWAYPEKPIKLVVPYTPGGAADQMARAIGEKLGQELKQSVIIENKPGASTRIAATYVARSAPDGYTLFMGSNSSIVLNPLLYKKSIEYSANDLKVAGLMTEMPLIVVANPKVPANTVSEFAAYSKNMKGKLNYASIGLGNPLQLATEMLNQRADIDILHVPYNGSAPALTSLMANDTQMMVDGIITSLPLVRDNRLKALAVMSDKRLSVLPDVPTVAESGFPGFRAATWFGIAVPAKTPVDITNLLNATLNKILNDQSFIETFSKLGMVVQSPRTLADINHYVDQDRQTWGKLITDNNFQLD